MGIPGEYDSVLWMTLANVGFQIGSVIQWYESLSKYPIWVDKKVEVLGRQAS